MKNNFKNLQGILFLFTGLFFVIGMVHVSFSIIGLLCFILPFLYFSKYKTKIWCQYICPRAGFLQKIFSKINLNLTMPTGLKSEKLKQIVVRYFLINIFFIFMSTTAVTLGKIAPIDQVRFLIVFGIPLELPQLLTLEVPNTLLHLGYRVYSMMFTSVTVGMILGILYKPRTWCMICPVNTLTTIKTKQTGI